MNHLYTGLKITMRLTLWILIGLVSALTACSWFGGEDSSQTPSEQTAGSDSGQATNPEQTTNSNTGLATTSLGQSATPTQPQAEDPAQRQAREAQQAQTQKEMTYFNRKFTSNQSLAVSVTGPTDYDLDQSSKGAVAVSNRLCRQHNLFIRSILDFSHSICNHRVEGGSHYHHCLCAYRRKTDGTTWYLKSLW